MKVDNLYSGVVYDALRFDLNLKQPFVLSSEIKPLWNFTTPVFGKAFTCRGEKVSDPTHIDDNIRLKMFAEFFPGCIQVISSGGFKQVAQFGDISGKIAKKFGAMAVILDGPSRDTKIIENDCFPVFASTSMPIDAYGKWQIADYMTPISMPGIEGTVTVEPNDFIFADRDGVIVIPQELINDTIDAAQKRQRNEDVIRSELDRSSDIIELSRRIGRW